MSGYANAEGNTAAGLCEDCPPVGYPTDKTRCLECPRRPAGSIFTPEAIEAASAEVERLTRELDITNADHIALWLEANLADSPLGWLACRIVEAHERAGHVK